MAREIPNTDSISASFEHYEELPGIRVVPLADFDSDPYDMFYAADDIRRSKDLAQQIASSGWISPLIVVIDEEGSYVLEGGHRLAALHILGVEEFPALVVVEE